MANELFSYERVEAEQCIQGKLYDVPSASAAEQWAMALWARILKGVRELYNEHGVVPPPLVQRLFALASSHVLPSRISYGQLVQDAAANEWYEANKENGPDPNEWFKYTDDAKKTHYVRAPMKNGYVECYRVVASREWKWGFVIEYLYSADVVVRLNCQKRTGAHCHYGDRPPGTSDRSYATTTAIGFCLLHEGTAIPLFPNKNHDGIWMPLLLICEGAQRVRADADILPIPTHKALTKLEPLRGPTAPSAANGGEPTFKSTWVFDFQATCICVKSHEENVLPNHLTNFLIKERRATYSFARVDAHEPSVEVVRCLYFASESLLGLPAVLHTAQQPADWFKQPVLFDVELQPGKYGMEQHVRAAFNCCHPMLETYHMTPGILSDLLKQFERVEPKAVIGHFGREPNTGAWIAHNGVALRRDDDGLGVSTASHAAIGVAVLKSAIQKLNRNSTLVMPELATMPAPWLRYELFYRIWSGNCAELPSLLYDAFTCNVMSAKCAIACSLLFLHTGALRDGHVNAVSGPPILWMHGDPLTGKSKTASLLGALFGLKNSGGASTASAIYDRLSQVADAPVVVDDINPKAKFLNDVARHGHDGLPRSVSGKMTEMRAGIAFTSNGVPPRAEDTAMASRLLLLPFVGQKVSELDTDSAGLLNGSHMREILSSLLQDVDSIRLNGELDAQAIEECTLYLQMAVGGDVLRRGINLWGSALYCMLIFERAAQCAAADLARVIDWVVEQAGCEAHASTIHDGLLPRFVVALGLVAPFGWGLTNAASQARACSSISYHNAVESVRFDGVPCYALQLESVCAAIKQQLNQSFDPTELRQAVRKLKPGAPLHRDFWEGRTQFYDASAGPFPPMEHETRRYYTQAEALASCHTVNT